MKKTTKKVISLILSLVFVIGLVGCGKGSGSGAGNPQSEEAKMAAAKQNVFKAQALDFSTVLEKEENLYGSKMIDGKIYMLTSQYFWEELTGMKINLISMNPDGSGIEKKTIYDATRPNDMFNMDWGNDFDGEFDGEFNEGVDYIPYEEELAPEQNSLDEYEIPGGAQNELDDVNPGEANPAEVEDGAGDGEAKAGTRYTEDGYEIIENFWVNGAALSKSGIAIVAENSGYYTDADGNYNSLDSTLELIVLDFNGNEKKRVVLNEDQNNSYMYANTIVVNDDGVIALNCEEKLMMFDADGNLLLEKPFNNTNGWTGAFFFDKSGVLNYIRYTYSGEESKSDLNKVDPKTKQVEEGINLDVNLNNYSIQAGIAYDLFLTGSIGAYGYNFGDKELTPIMNYINSDIDSSSVNAIIEVDAEHLLMLEQPENWNDPTNASLLTYVKPEDIKDRKIISMGCYWLDYNLRKRIVEYNKTNEDYRITVTDYSEFSTPDDYMAGITTLNNDIIAGRMPDILVVDSYSMPMDSYIAKGIFTDIKKLIDEDPELNADDYFANVFEAYSVDGKMYQLVSDFSVSTVIGKTALVGDKEGWTMDDLKALMAKYPDSSVFGTSMTRDSILWMTMMYSGTQFIDAKSGKCHFDSQEFVDLLEFIKQFPQEFDYESLPENWWMEQQNAYRTNGTLLYNMTISDPESYINIAKGQFGEPVTMIGFPASEGIGAVIQPGNNSFAIAAKSKNIDGAWNFLRYYLTKDYQSSDQISWSLPVMKSEAMKRLEKGMEKPFWEDPDGNKEYYDYSYWNGNEEIILDPLTRAEVDELFAYVEKVNKAYYYDENLSKIINEEAAAFFAGQKDAKSVADIIQNRAQLYINENR